MCSSAAGLGCGGPAQCRAALAAVHGHKRPVLARAVEVNGPRDDLLARAGLAVQQHGDGRTQGALDQAEDLLHGQATTDDFSESLPHLALTREQRDLIPQLGLRQFQRLVQTCVLDGNGDTAGERFEEG